MAASPKINLCNMSYVYIMKKTNIFFLCCYVYNWHNILIGEINAEVGMMLC